MFKLNNKTITLILSMIVIVLGVTYALYRWNSSENTNVSLTFAGAGEVIYSAGQEINATNIGPVLDINDGESTTFAVKKNTTNEVTVNINFTPTNLPEELKYASFKYELQVSSNNVDFVKLISGDFSDKVVNNKFIVKDNYLINNSKIYFKLIIYIDGSMNNPVDMQGKNFSGTIEVVLNTRNIPDVINVPEGMIPVVYNETNSTWETVAVPYKLGDVDGDNVADIIDSIKISQIINGGNFSYWQLVAGDVDGNGILTPEDANLILKADVGLITAFPAGGILEEKMYIPTGSDKSWYNYDSKLWANAVMVTSATRDTYMNASLGTEITEADILAYYVWIPRYKYKLFNSTFIASSPQKIEIIFENTTDPISNGTTNGEYLSHPAFWWDNDSDGVREAGEELSGIWVGKFETTGSAATPTILPNITALTNQNVSTQFTTAQKLGTSTYLTENGVNQADSHMMKNMEWGAVAYLSHSKYGKNSEITINDTTSYLTGDGDYKINVEQSTTGNITGIYDMAGGVWEYVMGVMEDNTETNIPMSGYSTSSNSGWTGKTYASGNWTQYTGITFPDKKYYDLYEYGITYNDQTAYNRSHLGDATGETHLWYSDDSYFVGASYPWLTRGARHNVGSLTGAFAFSSGTNYGSGSAVIGFRGVIVNDN